MKTKEALLLFSRYGLLVVLGLFNLKLFYSFFTPVTVYPAFWLARFIDPMAALFPGGLIFFKGLYAEIIPACVAGAAYYLLIILNLTTPMDFCKRAKSLGFLIGSLLVLNVLRILAFMELAVVGYAYFDIAHRFTWYFGSTVLVVALWFFNVWLFKIKEIPVYSDFRNLIKEIRK